MEPKDKLGRDIEVGSYIAYGHAMGRCAGLKIGKVLSITRKDKDHNGYQLWSFSVIGVNDDHQGFFGISLSRKGTLQFRDRIIVIDSEQLPIEYHQLLKDFS